MSPGLEIASKKMFNQLAINLLIINFHLSIITIFSGILLFIFTISCLKNVHINVKILFLPMLLGIIIIPISNFFVGILIFSQCCSDTFVYSITNIISSSGTFIRSIDLSLSIERLIATVHSKNYEQKYKFIGPLFLILSLILGITFGSIIGVGKFFFVQRG